MSFSQDMINAVDQLSHLESLLNTSSLWNICVESGLLSSICKVSLALSFFMTVAAILRTFYHNGADFRPQLYISEFMKMIFVTMFFNISQVYSHFASLIAGLSTKLNNSLVADSVFSYQVQFRAFLYGIQNTSQVSASTSIKSSNLLSLILSFANELLIGFYFCIISIGPAFLILSLLLAPLAMSFSLFLPSVAYNWIKILLSSFFFSAITAIGLMSVADSGVLQIASDYTFGNTQLVALLMVIAIIFVLQIIPLVIATVYQCHVFSFVSNSFSFLMAALGLFPMAFNSIVSTQIVKGVIKRAQSSAVKLVKGR